MKDKDYKKQKRRVEKLIKKWTTPLGLGWWRISFEWSDQHKSPDEVTRYAPTVVKGDWRCVMDVASDPSYMDARVVVYLPAIEDMEDSRLEETFLHEMMHIFLAPMRHKTTAKEEEFVATRLALAFMWATKAAQNKKL